MNVKQFNPAKPVLFRKRQAIVLIASPANIDAAAQPGYDGDRSMPSIIPVIIGPGNFGGNGSVDPNKGAIHDRQTDRRRQEQL
jgi:hypothetical protein